MPNSYPAALTIINPGAETGNATGWIAINSAGGAIPRAHVPAAGVHGGSFAWSAASNAPTAWWGQTIAIPEPYHVDVDSGLLGLLASVWRAGFVDDNDSGSFNVVCFAADSSWLAGRYGEQTDPATWTLEQKTMRVPPGTRFIQLSARGVRVGGTNLDAYYDDWSLFLTKQTDACRILYSDPDPTTGGWSVVTGAFANVIEPNTNSKFGLEMVLFWNGAFGESYREFTFTGSDQLSCIDAGSASMLFMSRLSTFDSTGHDLGRHYMEFYSGSSTLLGSRVYSNTVAFEYAVFGQDFTFTTSVPLLARKVRLGLLGVRNQGTALDAYNSRMALLLTGIPLPASEGGEGAIQRYFPASPRLMPAWAGRYFPVP